ncbi:MAG: hypothetical protein P8H39_12345 [Thalassotalea sp.]|nr:hypothetical protein [Thalassotalea sp.]
MNSLNRSVKTLKASTSVVACFSVSEFKEVVVCKFTKRSIRTHYLVYQKSLLENRRLNERIPMMVEAARIGDEFKFSSDDSYVLSPTVLRSIKQAISKDSLVYSQQAIAIA